MVGQLVNKIENISKAAEDLQKGLDISHWNNKVDWSKVAKDGIKFSFAKATEGATYQDPTFEQNFKGMKDNNIQAGGYHVFRMTSTPDEQITNINNTFTKAGFRLNEDKLAISATTGICSSGKTKCDDPAAHSNQQRAENLNDLLTKLNKAGYHPIVFASPKTWNDYYTQGEHDFSEYPLWVAHWTEEKAPLIPKDWKDAGKSYDYWNYSCKGKVEGISGNVCLDEAPQNAVQNVLNGDQLL